jgi:glycerol-3-phosphate dehydrogenase (NAD(P)+)
VGAGSWGTTLANVLAEKGHRVDLWVYERELVEIIRRERENTFYLPGFPVHEGVRVHDELEHVVAGHDLLLMAVPSHVYRGVALLMRPLVAAGARIINATKGIENDTLLTMSGVCTDVFGDDSGVEVLCLSGPSFAREVSAKIPTAVTLAGESRAVAREIQQIIATPHFRVYTSEDRIGVELAGALKNVIALAAGAIDGLGFGHNTRAALITRGLAEISRLGVRMGANPLTFLGLSGVGDLVLTCTGELSRNRRVGFLLGQGKTLAEVLRDMRMVAEGVKTAQSTYHLARRMGVEMPICEQVYAVLHEGKEPAAAVHELMQRDLKHELDDDDPS